MENKNKFQIVSKVYQDNFKKVIFVVFNSETGELIKKTMQNKVEDVYKGNDMKIISQTAKGIQSEIKGLLYEHVESIENKLWNQAIAEAANCCNGYNEVEEEKAECKTEEPKNKAQNNQEVKLDLKNLLDEAMKQFPNLGKVGNIKIN